MPVLAAAVKRLSLASVSSSSPSSPTRFNKHHNKQLQQQQQQQQCQQGTSSALDTNTQPTASSSSTYPSQTATSAAAAATAGPGKMAAFKKFLSATKNKMKSNLKVNGGNGLGGTLEEDEEFEARKHEWQEELDQMSEFLVLKSTEEQKEEGVENPVDTAYIEDRDGMPIMKAVFDVHHFKPEEVQLSVEDGQLTLVAQCLEDRDSAVFKKTMIRRIDLPKHVDHKMIHCSLNGDGILNIEMPFHLPPQRRPVGPSVVPIVDVDGSRRIRLQFNIGPDFTADDIRVERNGRTLSISAAYDAEIGVYGREVTQRQLNKELKLPEFAEIDRVEHKLEPDGRLIVDVVLKHDRPYKCTVSTQDLTDINDNDDVNDDVDDDLDLDSDDVNGVEV